MRRNTNINDFRFELAGYGLYRVIYVSPATGGQWSTMINYMKFIVANKNEDEPKHKDL